MDLFQIPVLLVSPVILLAYVCRLSMLSFRANKPAIVVMHMSLAVAVAWAAYHAFIGEAVLGDVASLIGAGCWIFISFKSWRGGVPEHFHTRPSDLDNPIQLNQIGGGRK